MPDNSAPQQSDKGADRKRWTKCGAPIRLEMFVSDLGAKFELSMLRYNFRIRLTDDERGISGTGESPIQLWALCRAMIAFSKARSRAGFKQRYKASPATGPANHDIIIGSFGILREMTKEKSHV